MKQQQNRQPQAAVGIDAKTAARSPLGIDCFPDLVKKRRDRAGGEDRVDERKFISESRATTQELNRAALERRWQQHRHCTAEVRRKGPHWGVYCSQHGTWMQWITGQQAQLIQGESNGKMRHDRQIK